MVVDKEKETGKGEEDREVEEGGERLRRRGRKKIEEEEDREVDEKGGERERLREGEEEREVEGE